MVSMDLENYPGGFESVIYFVIHTCYHSASHCKAKSCVSSLTNACSEIRGPGRQEVSKCCTRDVTRVPLSSVNKAANYGFETQILPHQKSTFFKVVPPGPHLF